MSGATLSCCRLAPSEASEADFDAAEVGAGVAAAAAGEGFDVVDGAASSADLPWCAIPAGGAPTVADAPGGIFNAAVAGVLRDAPGAVWPS